MIAMPNMAKAMCMALPTPAALIASGPSPPTITVSTTPIDIQPSSAITTGMAMRSIGMSSVRIEGKRPVILVGFVSMRRTLFLAAVGVSFATLASLAQVGHHPGAWLTTVLASPMRYTMNYQQLYAVHAADHHYVEEPIQ